MIKKKVIIESIDYILEHLEEDISVKDVANHFHYSEFYFSRSFKLVTGNNIYGFIKRLKMDQSAIDIKLKRNKSITDIALDYGYSSSNYSSAFRKHHNNSPTEFSKSININSVKNPFHLEIHNSFKDYLTYDNKIKIEFLEDVEVAYERIIGNYYELKDKWGQFMNNYKDYFKVDTLMIERFYDDPTIASLNNCICDLCITIDKGYKFDNITIIKGGKFATYRFEGEIKDIFCTLQGIFTVWFPRSGYVMDKRYGFNIYRKIDRATDYVILDLCIPIK